jgi:hypothetical protein
VVFSHAAGTQVITVTCNLPASFAAFATGARRRRCHRRRRRRRCAATTMGASTDGTPLDVAASAVAALADGDVPTPPSPEAITPPPKRIQRRHNEVELLRGADGEDDLLLSPLSCTSPSPPILLSSPFRAHTLSTASPLLLPSAPLDHVPASPPTCPPTPPEFPESPPPTEAPPAPPPPPAADPPSQPTSPLQPASRPLAPSTLANSSPPPVQLPTRRHHQLDSRRLPPAILLFLNGVLTVKPV